MSHIERCRNVWFATLKVPEALRVTMGRTKFKQTLQTTDKRLAVILAAPIVAGWQAQVRQAAGQGDAVQIEAMKWREALADVRAAGDDDNTFAVETLMQSKAEDIARKRGDSEADRFAEIASGRSTPSNVHFDAWYASTLELTAKTRDQMKKDVQVLVDHFPTLEAITAQSVAKFVDKLTKAGATRSSINRMLGFWRNYWRYLASPSVEAVPVERQPFAAMMVKAAPRKTKAGWVPFPAGDVVKLWEAADAQKDEVLASLIRLGAYTGARIEELSSLKLTDVSDKAISITDSKTAAGIREVPIHSALLPLIKRLKKSAKDEYLLPGLTFNKYGDRSNAIGKRFGRLKDALGFGEQHVFHSLRKTLVTLLEDAGVSENLAADIVGHEKPRITYGLYSGGASLANKAAALELVRYSEG